jgi:plasmid stability protein
VPGLLIKNLPSELHRKLKEQAARNHRSMTKEALALLQRALEPRPEIRELLPPYQGRIRLTDRLFHQAKREGRS